MEPRRHIDIVRSDTPRKSPAWFRTWLDAGGNKETNLYRRNLLKLAAVGGGAFIVGKFSGPVMDLVLGDKVLSMRDFKDFRFVETTKELKVLDKSGGEILIVDKDVVGR